MIGKLKSNLIKKISSGGYTLTELLAYVTMSSLLLTGIGIVLNDIVTKSTESQKESLRKQEANKALDLIAKEVRIAEKISADPSRPSELDKLSETFDNVTDSNPILVLDVSALSSPIVYEIANLKDSAVWQGPMAIYRWGPSIDSEGNYNNPESPGNWQPNILIDSIQSNVADDNSKPDYCKFDSNDVMEPYNEVIQIPSNDPKGFYICVPKDTDGGTPSLMAQVVIRGRIADKVNDPEEPQVEQKISTTSTGRSGNCALF